jgi:hypothetical protein
MQNGALAAWLEVMPGPRIRTEAEDSHKIPLRMVDVPTGSNHAPPEYKSQALSIEPSRSVGRSRHLDNNEPLTDRITTAQQFRISHKWYYAGVDF